MLGQRLFYFTEGTLRMDIKQTFTNAVDKVEEAIGVKPEVQVPVVAPATPTTGEPIVAAAQPVTPVADRSAYNCPDCKGEGLKSDTEKCPNCGGTGKV